LVTRSRPPGRLAARAAAAVLAALLAGAVLAPVLAPFDPAAQLDIVALQNRPPSAAHPLGTDPYSRDVLSRVLHAARTSLGVAALAAGVATAIGAAWGALAGAAGGPVDRVLMRLVDVLLGVPRLLVLLAVAALWGEVRPAALALLLGLTAWPSTSRVVRARVAQVRGEEFVTAARALGASPLRVLARHVPPHLAGTLAVSATVLFAEVLGVEAGLSYLGLGVRPPAASWGSMVQDGTPFLLTAWWTAAFPTLCVVLSVLSATVLGDALAERARGGGAG
jgi:peptide/nickel transport system permease protein